MQCEYFFNGNLDSCIYCGQIKENINRECPVARDPSIVQKVTNFVPAMISHFLNGSPEASQEQINDRLAICKECPYFRIQGLNRGSCAHIGCGCNINSEQQYMNKLAWKDQKCPINKWEEVDEKYNN